MKMPPQANNVLIKRTLLPLSKHLSICCLAYALLIPNARCDTTQPAAIHFKVKEFVVQGSLPVPAKTVTDYLHPLQQRDYSLKELQEVSNGLEQLLQARGYAFYRVVLPPQTLKSGVVTLQVMFTPLGHIDISGNDYFSRDNILASLPVLQQGSAPNTQDVASAL